MTIGCQQPIELKAPQPRILPGLGIHSWYGEVRTRPRAWTKVLQRPRAAKATCGLFNGSSYIAARPLRSAARATYVDPMASPQQPLALAVPDITSPFISENGSRRPRDMGRKNST